MSNSKSDVRVLINLQQSHTQNVDVTQRILGLIQIGELIKLFDKLDLKANPRDAKKSSITKQIQQTLRFEPQIFPLKSKGILISGSAFVARQNGDLEIVFKNLTKEGIIDGGHNSLAIGQYILDNALAFSGNSYRSKAKNWKVFKSEFAEFRDLIAEYQSSKEGQRILSTLVSIEILLPRSTQEKDIENFNQALAQIQDARNNNAQVKLSALLNNRSVYDSFKEQMPKELSEKIQWRTNDGSPIAAEKVVALSFVAINAFLDQLRDQSLYVIDSEGKKIPSLNPPQMYSSKESCVKLFKRFSDSATFPTSVVTEEMINSVYSIAGELPGLFDLIFKEFPKSFDIFSNKKFKSIDYVKKENSKPGSKKTPFFENSVECVFPEAYVYPIFYSLKKLLVLDKTLHWSQDPKEFLKTNLPSIVNKYNSSYMKGLQYEPQKIGKKKDIYIFLEEVVEGMAK